MAAQELHKSKGEVTRELRICLKASANVMASLYKAKRVAVEKMLTSRKGKNDMKDTMHLNKIKKSVRHVGAILGVQEKKLQNFQILNLQKCTYKSWKKTYISIQRACCNR